ncbi:beta strand repeat-containing protein, partial [Undibacterium baiyunense]
YDVTSASNATGGGTNNITTSNAVNVSGTGAAIAGTVGTTPSNGGGAVAVTAGGTFNGTVGNNEQFMSSIPNLNNTTIAGNAADTDTLTLTTAGTVTLNNGATGGNISNIKVLKLANGTNTITYNNSAGFATITGGTGDDTFIPNSALFPMVVNGGNGTDTLVLPATYAATASGSGTFASNVTSFEKLRLTGVTNQTIDMQTLGSYNDVTFSGANGLTLMQMASNSNITLTGAGTAFTISNAAFVGGVNDILNVSLIDGSGAGVSFASTGITASGIETANISINDTQGTPTGAFNNNLTWLGNSVKTINLSGNAGLSLTANSTALTTVNASGITLGNFTWTSNALTGAATITGTNNGTNTVNINAATVAASYAGGSGNDNVAANGTLSNTVVLGSGINSLTLSGSAILGSYTSGAGTNDTITLASATPDISAATVTGFENLNLPSNSTLTATAAQVAQFATGTITAAGTETINLTTAGTFSALSGVEVYNLANGTNNFTSADVAISVIGGTGSDTFNFTANQIANFLTTIDGGSGFDILNIGSTTTQSIDISTKVNSVETVNVAGSTGTASFTMQNGAGYLLSYAKSTGDNTITLGSGGQSFNLTGSSSAPTTITGGAAVDFITLPFSGGASETFIQTGANMSNRTQIDKIANFSATGVDFFKTGVNASIVGSYIIGNENLGTYLTTIANGLSGVLTNTGQVYLITIQTGTAAGTYLFQNTGSINNQFDDADFFVQLIGAFGSISTVNMIA